MTCEARHIIFPCDRAGDSQKEYCSFYDHCETMRSKKADILGENICTLKTEQKELKVICKATERSFKRKFEGKSDI